jgi:hypothetical protein
MCPFLEAPKGLSPETLEMLDRTFTAAWNELQARKSPCTLPENEQATRVAITKSTMELAATGVREPERLKRHALHAAEHAEPRTRTIVHLPD